MSFNCPHFVDEFREFVSALGVESVLEVGCHSGELKDAVGADGIDLSPTRPDVVQADVRTYRPRRKWDLVFSSGLLEHYPLQEAVEIIRSMARLSKRYILNYAPNRDCLAYKNAKARTKASWKDELDFTADELAQLHEVAGLKVLATGYAASEWARRFGWEPSQPYLVYCLAQVATKVGTPARTEGEGEAR